MATEISRDIFCKMFEKYKLNELFYDAVDGNKFTEISNFLIYVDNELEQVTIINRNCLEVIRWYKYLHPGRALEVAGIENKEELKEFLRNLSDKCKERLNAN